MIAVPTFSFVVWAAIQVAVAFVQRPAILRIDVDVEDKMRLWKKNPPEKLSPTIK